MLFTGKESKLVKEPGIYTTGSPLFASDYFCSNMSFQLLHHANSCSILRSSENGNSLGQLNHKVAYVTLRRK